MKCSGCTERILKKVSLIPGVHGVMLDLEAEEITFEYSSFNSPESVKNVLKQLGYPLYEEANTIKDQVQSYVSCMIGRVNL